MKVGGVGGKSWLGAVGVQVGCEEIDDVGGGGGERSRSCHGIVHGSPEHRNMLMPILWRATGGTRSIRLTGRYTSRFLAELRDQVLGRHGDGLFVIA